MSTSSRRYITDTTRANAVARGTYVPCAGDAVKIEDGTWDVWIIVSHTGKLCAETMVSPKTRGGFKHVAYGAGAGTWVVQRATAKSRNPVWTDPSRNGHGEGEHEQRHVVPTRDDLGVIRYWPYFDDVDEIDAIMKWSGLDSMDDLYIDTNRVTHTSAKADSGSGAGFIARISDYLYFSNAACAARELAVSEELGPDIIPPTYTRDFETFGTVVRPPTHTRRALPLPPITTTEPPPPPPPAPPLLEVRERTPDPPPKRARVAKPAIRPVQVSVPVPGLRMIGMRKFVLKKV